MNTCLDEFGENRLVQMPSSIAPTLKHVSITNQQERRPLNNIMEHYENTSVWYHLWHVYS
jgi:hypothetical protein